MIRAPPPCSLGGPPPLLAGGGRGMRSRVPNALLFCLGPFPLCNAALQPLRTAVLSCFVCKSARFLAFWRLPSLLTAFVFSLACFFHALARLARFWTILRALLFAFSQSCPLWLAMARSWASSLAFGGFCSLLFVPCRLLSLSCALAGFRFILGNFALSWASLLALARCCHSCSLFCRSLSF